VLDLADDKSVVDRCAVGDVCRGIFWGAGAGAAGVDPRFDVGDGGLVARARVDGRC